MSALSRVLLFLFFTCSALRSSAQGSVWSTTKNTTDKVKQQAGRTAGTLKKWKQHLQEWGLDSNYTHSIQAGLRLNTNGLCGMALYEKRAGNGRYNLVQLSFTEVKHEKQAKQQRENKAFPELGGATPYVYGKINNLYLLQLGIGREQLLLPGVLDGNITVSFRFQIGASLAMLKPYYLKLIYVDYTQPVPEGYLEEARYTDANADHFLNTGYILGASKWSKGLDELHLVPGGYIDGAFVLQPGKNKSFVQTVTLGGQFSLYPEKLPIMAERRAYPWMGCLYVGLCLGKRWE